MHGSAAAVELLTVGYSRISSALRRNLSGASDRQQRLFIRRVQPLGFSFGELTERGSQTVNTVRVALSDFRLIGLFDFVGCCRR